jgi:hypothetical protein
MASSTRSALRRNLLSTGALFHHADKGAAIPREGDAKTVLSSLQDAPKRK